MMMKLRMSLSAKVLYPIIAGALTLGGCATGGGQPPAAKSATSEAPASNTRGVTAINPEDLVSYANTIVVPTAYVRLLVEGNAFAAQKGGYKVGSDANAVQASAKYKVVGIDKKLAQSIAQQAYDDFVAKLRAEGYTVLTYNDIRDRDYVKGASREKADASWGLPLEKSRAGNETFVVAAPSDDQHFKSGMNGGVFNQFISLGKPRFKDATVIIPQYTITAPQVWGEAEGTYSTISAAIKTEPGMRLQSAYTQWMGAPKVRMMKGIPGVTANGPVKITEKVGDLVKAADTTPEAANAISKGLSLLGGGGSSKRSSAEYTFTIDPNAYVAGALKGTNDFNEEVAKVAAAAKKP